MLAPMAVSVIESGILVITVEYQNVILVITVEYKMLLVITVGYRDVGKLSSRRFQQAADNYYITMSLQVD